MRTKSLHIILILMLLGLVLCLSACGSTENAQSSPAPEYAYSSETLFKVESSKENALAAQPSIITDDGYYAIGGRYTEGVVPEGAVAETEGQFDTVIPCISFVSNDGTVKELSGYTPVAKETGNEDMRDFRTSNSIEALELRSDGNLLLVESVYSSWNDADPEIKYGSEEYYDHLSSDSSWWLRVLMPDGSEVSSAQMDITEEDSVSLYTCTVDEKDNLLASQTTGLIAFSTDGKKAYEIETDDYIYSLGRTAEGRAAALVYDTKSSAMSLKLLSSEAGAFDESSHTIGMDAYGLIDGCGDYDIYYTSGSSVFGCKFAENSYEKLFSWIDCDLNANSMSVISFRPDGTVRAISMDYNSDEETQTAEFVLIKKTPYDSSADKKHLKLATLYPNDVMIDSVISFNRAHRDVRIDIVDYSEYNTEDDISAGFTKLTTEIAAGNMPDILDISGDFPYNRYAANGILLDLYPYIDKDPELSRDDFFENILKCMEVNDGLYVANAGFGIFTAAGASSVVGDKPGITYDGYFEALSKMPDGCEGFDVGYDRETALSMSVALEFPKLVNWSTGECHFDSENFIKILNYAAHFGKFDGENYVSSAEDATSVRVAEGRQMLAEVVFTSVNYMLTDYDSMFGGQATIVGFPTSEGVGNMLYLTDGLAITSRCSDPDTAWEYLRTYFTEDYQKKQYMIPANKNVFEQKLSKAMEVEYEKDANGNYKLDENGERIKKSYGYYFDGTQQVNVYAITERQAQMLRDSITNTTRLLNFDESIDNIISETAQAFFEGQKTAEECAQLIQSKVKIYLNEHI